MSNYPSQPPYAAYPNADRTSTRPTSGLERAARPLVWISTACTGVMAGLYFAFATSVMPGLAGTDDATFVATMNGANRSIQNPAFGFVFGGALVFTAAAVFVHVRLGRRRTAGWLAAALVLYVVTLVLTLGINVPLNDDLATVHRSASAAALAAARTHFEDKWNASNIARTLVCLLSFAALATAATRREDRGA